MFSKPLSPFTKQNPEWSFEAKYIVILVLTLILTSSGPADTHCFVHCIGREIKQNEKCTNKLASKKQRLHVHCRDVC